MTYIAQENSIESGQPVELYEFSGLGSFFYTSGEDIVTISAQDYTPKAIQRAENIDGPDKRDHDFKVVLPTSDAVAQIFVGVMPGARIRMKVKRFHRTDVSVEVITIFDGFVQSASFKNKLKECELVAKPALASIGRTAPRRTFQSSCNHVLYDPLTCKVDDTLAVNRAAAFPVISQVGNILTVSGLSSGYTNEWFTAGFVEVVGVSDFRTVLAHSGNALTLITPFTTTPTNVNVFAGCGHDVTTCHDKFDNVVNYGGFSWVPKRNPFETGI